MDTLSTANQNTSNTDRVNGSLNASSTGTIKPILAELFPVFGVLICVIGLLGNLSVLIAFFTHRRLRTKINCFLVSLAFSDLLLTGISIPLELEYFIRTEFIHGVVICELMYTVHFVGLSCSSLNLLAVSVYRYLTIAFPFSMKLVQPVRVMLAIAGLWMYSVITGLLPLMGWRSFPTSLKLKLCLFAAEPEYALFILSVNWLCPAVLVLILYGLIFRIARVHAIKIAKHQVLGEYERIRSPLFKGAKTLGKIVAVYLICCYPYVIEAILTISKAPVSIPRELHLLFLLFYYASSAINPFLYAGLCTDFREVFSECANKGCSKLSVLFQRLAALPRRIVSSLFSDASEESSVHNSDHGRHGRERVRTRSGSSSFQQPTVATFVWMTARCLVSEELPLSKCREEETVELCGHKTTERELYCSVFESEIPFHWKHCNETEKQNWWLR